MLLRKMIPYVVVLLLAFYVPPLLMKDTGSAMLLLLLVMPMITIVASFLYGKTNGFQFLYPIIVMVMFLPSVYIFYNDSAFIYVFVFGAMALVASFFGAKTIQKKERKP